MGCLDEMREGGVDGGIGWGGVGEELEGNVAG